MNTKTIVRVLCLVLLVSASACADPERYTPPENPNPQLEMCHVHMVFSSSYYEGEGYVWDVVFIKNGQDESVKVLMTYTDDDAVALEKTMYHLTEHDYDIFINKGEDIDVHVKFQDDTNTWVDCPGSPAHIGL